NKAPAVFDYQKLEWFNGQYIRMKSDDELSRLFIPYLHAEGLVGDPPTDEEYTIIRGMVPLVKERLKVLSEVPGLSRFLFTELGEYPVSDLIPKKLDAKAARSLLEAARPLVEKLFDETDEEAEESFKLKAEELKVKLGDLLMPVRVAVTGSKVSPPLFGSLRLLGKEKSLKRIDRALEMLAAS
ncbi:MAG TPA: glutamate--tRNA ligase, partial [Spirochaetia bacterium]|nr:glutamate--tRNA ligase [Spirochaetia bacterium]